MTGIHFVSGKPGAGKGLYFMMKIVYALMHHGRPMVTDFAVEKDAWVNGKHQAQIGLLAYFFQLYKDTQDADDKLFRISPTAAGEFFLYRVLPASVESCDNARAVTLEDGVMTAREFARHVKWRLWKADCMVQKKKDQFGQEVDKIMDFKFDLLNLSGGHDYFLDEVWKHWGARNWQRTGEGIQVYSRQHRKVADEVWLASQRPEDIESIVRGLCQDFHHLRNRGRLTVKLLGFFKARQPEDHRFVVTESPFTGSPNQSMLDEGGFKRDALMCQCYDTTSGAGLVGRLAGDIGVKGKGFDFRWLYLLGLLLPALFFYVCYLFIHRHDHKPSASDKLASSMVHYAAPGTDTNSTFSKRIVDYFKPGKAAFGVSSVPSVLSPAGVQPVAFNETGTWEGDTNEVHCTGYTLLPNYIRVYFDNGDVAQDEEVNQITRSWVTCWHKKYRVVMGSVTGGDSGYTYQDSSLWGQVRNNEPGSVVVTPPVHGMGYDEQQQPINGFANMGQTSQRINANNQIQ